LPHFTAGVLALPVTNRKIEDTATLSVELAHNFINLRSDQSSIIEITLIIYDFPAQDANAGLKVAVFEAIAYITIGCDATDS
jgi:hypothetical protein